MGKIDQGPIHIYEYQIEMATELWRILGVHTAASFVYAGCIHLVDVVQTHTCINFDIPAYITHDILFGSNEGVFILYCAKMGSLEVPVQFNVQKRSVHWKVLLSVPSAKQLYDVTSFFQLRPISIPG